jgi:CheY-like chemotaxis protein
MSTENELYKPLVLCVDDDEWILRLTRAALESKGYRVLTASSGTAALEAFAVCPVDAVVLDYDMPEMTGGRVAQEMTQMKPHVPKLLFSGNTSIPREESRVFQAQCAKPTGMFSLMSHIGNMTSPQRNRDYDDVPFLPAAAGAEWGTVGRRA